MREGREGGQAAKPAILVVSALQGPVEKQVLAGMEEEGVPFVLERASADQQADELASGAALRSTLEVGVGIDGMGRVCVQHGKLTDTLPALSFDGRSDLALARSAGHNAARIVVGLPLRLS
ncbi:MAG: glycerol dehydratase reactivase beta/small subunit family protein [Selenomonadales bacterium]|jgi:hypothetical protein|nr:glycerol dehydratase reactivase beta/small subunit family protein [Selenomonadales bacterium]